MAKRIFVTGSSRGIGRQIAVDLVQAGYDVVLHAKSESKELLETANELCSEYLCFDISNIENSKSILHNYVENNGGFYGVVLNAGITNDATFAALNTDDWLSVINTNLNSFYAILNPLVMPMARAKEGRIVVISSVSGIIGNRGQSNYAASKAGLIGAAKSLAIELASRNITVNVVAPGLIKTDMTKDVDYLDNIINMIPAKRAGEAKEVSSLVEFLLSSKASYITKQVIGVNGGLC